MVTPRVAVLLVAFATVVAIVRIVETRAIAADMSIRERLLKSYQRPRTLPVPRGNALSPEKIVLGKLLFAEKRLSVDATVSCESCHKPALAFSDGVALGSGIANTKLKRHTPALWNLAWTPALFWDGRASSLEEQAKGPIEHPQEMGQPLAVGAARLAADPAYAGAFAKAFPEAPNVTPDTIVQALASYERTLVSPRTRFDAWIDGKPDALTPSEIRGFDLFNGKARCASCHSGWAFTDHGFHDIGLPGDDLGRGPIIALSAVNHAFKTPSLRELSWTAPYMHDGSLATLEDVIRHYEGGGVARPTRSPDMPPVVNLSDEERADLITFVESLSSERPPRPSAEIAVLAAARVEAPPEAVDSTRVHQKDKLFAPVRVRLRQGQTLAVVNDDTRPHNVRIFDPRLKFDSGLQEPGDTARITFKQSGTFEAFCGIHPTMRLSIEVK